MNKVAVTLSAVVLLLITSTLVGLWLIHLEFRQLRSQLTDAAQRTIDQRIAAVSKNVISIGTKVDEQTAIINRALGNIIPYKLPDDVNTRLASVKEQINSAITTPVDTASLEKIRSDLVRVVNALPPWAQEEILPTLVPLRWNLEALWSLANAEEVGEENLEGSVRSLDALLENRPIGSSDPLVSRLEDQRKNLEARISAAEKEAALTAANEKRESTDSNEIAAAIQVLAPYKDDVHAKGLIDQLKKRLAERLIQQAADDLRKSIEQYKNLADSGMRGAAFARGAQTAVDLRLQMIAAGLNDEPLSKTIQGLYEAARGLEVREIEAGRKTASKVEAAQRQRYQVWALKQMAKVRSLEALKKTGLTEPQARFQLRVDMTTYLAPIDEGLLDIAVGQWFRKVYSNRFEELADEGKPTLIGSFASTPKMTLEALP